MYSKWLFKITGDNSLIVCCTQENALIRTHNNTHQPRYNTEHYSCMGWSCRRHYDRRKQVPANLPHMSSWTHSQDLCSCLHADKARWGTRQSPPARYRSIFGWLNLSLSVMFFNNTWSQQEHFESWMTLKLFSVLQITILNTRPNQMGYQLGEYNHHFFLQGFVWVCTS